MLGRDDLQLGCVLTNAGDLQRVQDDDPAIALLRVEERVRDRDVHLVSQLRRTDRVAVDQDVRHGRILTASRFGPVPCQTRDVSAKPTGPRIDSKA